MNIIEWKKIITQTPECEPTLSEVHAQIEQWVGANCLSEEGLRQLVWALAVSPDLCASLVHLAAHDHAEMDAAHNEEPA